MDEVHADTLFALEGVAGTFTNNDGHCPVTVVQDVFGARSQNKESRLDMPFRRKTLLLDSRCLKIAGVQVKPVRGDSITVDFGLGVAVYRVAPDDGEPEWEDADTIGLLISVRCVLES
jgi:hypothetical protein